MARTVLLNNVEHARLRIVTRHGPAFGDNVNQALVFPTEYAELQREYPIFFRKDADGGFQSVALLGLDKGENLFLDETAETGWRANYVPAVQARGPFLIGFPSQGAEGESSGEPMILVDLDHSRVSASEGEPVFLPQGGNSPYLERIARILQVIHRGAALSKPMFAAFEAAGLIEPVAVEIKLGDGKSYKLPNYSTIGEDKLAALGGAALEQLNRAGFLYAAHLVVSSLGNVSRLIELKNRKRAAG